jgi:flagellar hook-length control protein FliK
MLQRDGVVLSGVSVGTSNSGGAGGQERQPRQGGQKSVVVAESPARGETRNWGTVQTGRALDLFV